MIKIIRLYTLMFACFSLGLSFVNSGWAEETPLHREVRETLQRKRADLPLVPLNTERDNIGFNSIDLTETLTDVQDIQVAAFRFRTPENIEGLGVAWCFLPPQTRERSAWRMMSAQGMWLSDKNSFQATLAQSVEGVGKVYNYFFLGSLSGRALEPNTDYIVCIQLPLVNNPVLPISLNLIPEASWKSLRELFPQMFQKNQEEIDRANSVNSSFIEGRRYMAAGQYKIAAELFRSALKRMLDVVGREHAATIETMMGLANCYLHLDQLEQSEFFAQMALAVNRKVHRRDNASFWGNYMTLAGIHERRKQFSEAEGLAEQALSIAKKRFGPRHGNTVASQILLARQRHRLGRHADAMALYKSALAIHDKELDHNDPENNRKLLSMLSDMIELSVAVGNESQAELYRKRRQPLEPKTDDQILDCPVFDPSSPGDYLAIDLSDGPGTLKYPVRYYKTRHDVPGGPNSDLYKTTTLLLRRIPKGTFMMGSPPDEMGRPSVRGVPDREKQRQVTLTKDYYIGVFPVTQKQLELVGNPKTQMRNLSSFRKRDYRDTRPVENIGYYRIRGKAAVHPDWPHQSSEVSEDSFIGILRAKTGLATLDLPTEAQWERACRAGTTTALNSGKDLSGVFQCINLSKLGRYRYSQAGGGSFRQYDADLNKGTAKVGSNLPNAWGLYDMHGNVREWCLDRRRNIDVSATTDPVGTETDSWPVVRGGSWNSYASSCRSASRASSSPERGSYDIGFRIALTAQ